MRFHDFIQLFFTYFFNQCETSLTKTKELIKITQILRKLLVLMDWTKKLEGKSWNYLLMDSLLLMMMSFIFYSTEQLTQFQLCCDKWRDHAKNREWVIWCFETIKSWNLPVKIIEERQEVDSELDPAFLHRFWQRVGVHDVGRIVETRAGHSLRPVLISPDVISDQRHIQHQRHPFTGKQEQNADQDVNGILWEDQRVQRITTVDWVP